MSSKGKSTRAEALGHAIFEEEWDDHMDEKRHSESEIRKSNHEQGRMDSHGFAALRIATQNESISLISRAALFTSTPRSGPRDRMVWTRIVQPLATFCHLLPPYPADSGDQKKQRTGAGMRTGARSQKPTKAKAS